MAGYTLAGASAILKEYVLPAAREQLNNATESLKLIEGSTDNVEGQEVVLSLHVSRNSGVGARKEGDNLPTAGKQGYVKMRVPMRTAFTGRGNVTIQALKGVKGGSAIAGVPGVTEMKGLVTDAGMDLNRQIWGTSNGVIAVCGTTSAATTVQLAAATTATEMRHLWVGRVIDIGTVASPQSIATEREITAVDTTNLTITISGAAVTTSGTSRIYVAGAGGASADQREMTGLQTIVASSGSLYGVDPATYNTWASTYNTAGGNRTPTEALFEKANDDVVIASGMEVDVVFTTHGVVRGYAATLVSNKRFSNTQTLPGGFGSGISFASGGRDIPLVRERDVPLNTAWGLNLSHVRRALWSDGLEYVDEDGAVLSRVPNQLGYEFTAFSMQELYTDRRNCHFVMDKLTES